MAFDEQTKAQVEGYVQAHIREYAWHLSYFDFIDNAHLAKRLGEEFFSTRYLYKILEGLGASDWLQRSQIRLQVLSYASIYEAVLHHILFENLSAEPQVIALTEFRRLTRISIPPRDLQALEKHLKHDGKHIIPAYEGLGRIDETKVRFDRKAECAQALGIIEGGLKDELIEFYEARNAIHIHAEIRKDLNYEIDLSKRSYRRLQPFKKQIVKWQNSRKT